MQKVEDLTGRTFGKLIVVERVENGKHGDAMWLCRCDCGQTKVVRAGDLRRRNGTKSCGCLKKQISREIHKTHGQSKSRVYKIWRKMLERCNNPNHSHYKNYGGRGITVCDEWQNSFEVFCEWAIANGYSENSTLDRKDNDSGYCPQNCRWATKEEQCNNKSNNRLIMWDGKTQTVSQICGQLGLKRDVVYKRLNNGWSIERALLPYDTRRKEHKKQTL